LLNDSLLTYTHTANAKFGSHSHSQQKIIAEQRLKEESLTETVASERAAAAIQEVPFLQNVPLQ